MTKLIHFTHWLVLAFVLTAWAWPFRGALWVHALFVPLMIVHWRTNRNRCFLSQLEERYKAAEAPVVESPVKSAVDLDLVDAEESQFIKQVIAKIFGRVPSDTALEKINYAVLGIVWVLSVSRLVLGARA